MRIYKTEELIKKGSHIHVFSDSPSRNHCEPAHTHDFIELVYISDGEATEVVDGKEYTVRQGDMIFLNYGCTHAFEAKGLFSYINICFSPETVGDAVITTENAFSLLSLTAFNEMRAEEASGVVSFEGDERREIESILSFMLSECRQKAVSWDAVMEHYLNILIAKMLRKSRVGVKNEDMRNIWQELSAYIDTNLDSELTLSALAKKCFYNPSYFSRIFKDRFGMSLSEYVNRKRMQHALQLLSETDLSVDEISRRIGFSDRRYFYQVFARYIGKNPSELRGKK